MREQTPIGNFSLIKTSTVLLVLVAIAAWYSNPDEASFRRWMVHHVTPPAENAWEQVAGHAVGHLAAISLDCDRTNFGFFSVVTVHGPLEVRFVGAFGNWWVLPAHGTGEAETP